MMKTSKNGMHLLKRIKINYLIPIKSLSEILMPLVNKTNLNNDVKEVNKVNLKFHLPEIKTNIPLELKNFYY